VGACQDSFDQFICLIDGSFVVNVNFTVVFAGYAKLVFGFEGVACNSICDGGEADCVFLVCRKSLQQLCEID
jgi:hypothetical protein